MRDGLWAQFESQIHDLNDEIALLRRENTSREREMRMRTWEKYVGSRTVFSPGGSGVRSPGAWSAVADGKGTPAHSLQTFELEVKCNVIPEPSISRDEYRAWAAEKREILARANAEKERLLAENKRLRASLDPTVCSMPCFVALPKYLTIRHWPSVFGG